MVESTCLGGEHRLTRQPRVSHDEVWTVALTKKQNKKNLYTSRNLLPNSVVFSFVEIFKNKHCLSSFFIQIRQKKYHFIYYFLDKMCVKYNEHKL